MDLAANAVRPNAEDSIARYQIDAKKSRFTVRAFATGMLSAFGHSPTIAIRDFDGEVHFTQTDAALADAGMKLTIRAESFEVTDDIKEKDRQEIQREMQTKVLETDRFPEIVYECSQATVNGGGDRYSVMLNGELSLHGVTRPAPVSARVTLNGDSMRAAGEFSIRQSDYDIAPVTAVAGTIKLKDELKFSFEIVARKQE